MQTHEKANFLGFFETMVLKSACSHLSQSRSPLFQSISFAPAQFYMPGIDFAQFHPFPSISSVLGRIQSVLFDSPRFCLILALGAIPPQLNSISFDLARLHRHRILPGFIWLSYAQDRWALVRMDVVLLGYIRCISCGSI